jgi:hypothetical protein
MVIICKVANTQPIHDHATEEQDGGLSNKQVNRTIEVHVLAISLSYGVQR